MSNMIFTVPRISQKRRLWREASARYRKSHPSQFRKWQLSNRKLFCLYSKKWRERNPEKVKQQEIKRRTLNRAAYLAWKRAINVKNRHKNKQYRLKNTDKIRAYAKRFYRKHRARYTCYAQTRRARLMKSTITKNLKAIERIYARALELRKWFDVCVDHIVPLAKGGSHCPSNLQIIYKSENLVKATRLDYKPRVIFR